MKLLDTSVAVDHLRGDQRATALLADLLRSERTVVASELTRFELLAGVRAHEQEDREHVEAFFLVVDWVPVAEEIARRAGSYARTYRRSHAGIGAADYVIASTASVLEADLLTLNVRHFPMFPALQVAYQDD